MNVDRTLVLLINSQAIYADTEAHPDIANPGTVAGAGKMQARRQREMLTTTYPRLDLLLLLCSTDDGNSDFLKNKKDF